MQDAKLFVEKRLVKLLEAGVVSALVCMVKQESPALTDTCRDCISRSASAYSDCFFSASMIR